MESILISVKKMLGIDEDYEQFDPDIIMHINSVFATLNQIGIGPEEGYVVSDSDDTWEDFIGDRKDIEFIKSYVYIRTRILFDPPTSSMVLEALKENAKEYEWRLLISNKE